MYERGAPVLPEAVHDGEKEVRVVAHGQPDQEAVEDGVHGPGQEDGDGHAVAQKTDLS